VDRLGQQESGIQAASVAGTRASENKCFEKLLARGEHIMHPEIDKVLVAQRHDELVHDTASSRRDPGRAARRGSSLVIIISARRSA